MYVGSALFGISRKNMSPPPYPPILNGLCLINSCEPPHKSHKPTQSWCHLFHSSYVFDSTSHLCSIA